jgi:hypothetical protein
VAVLAVSLLVIAALGWQLLGPGATETLTPANATAFDPYRQDRENDDLTPLALDGDETTAWSTEDYGDGDGTLGKPGVGLVLDLGERRRLETLRITSPTEGWSAAAFVLDEVPTAAIDEDHDPVAEASDISGDADLSLGGQEGSVVVLWITKVSTEGTVEVAEARVEAAECPIPTPTSCPPPGPAIATPSTPSSAGTSSTSTPCAGGSPATRPTPSTPSRTP